MSISALGPPPQNSNAPIYWGIGVSAVGVIVAGGIAAGIHHSNKKTKTSGLSAKPAPNVNKRSSPASAPTLPPSSSASAPTLPPNPVLVPVNEPAFTPPKPISRVKPDLRELTQDDLANIRESIQNFPGQVIGSGKSASVSDIHGHPQYVVRTLHGTNLSLQNHTIVPVQYIGDLQFLSRETTFGMPRAVLVQSSDPLAQREFIEPQEAFAQFKQEGTIVASILNKCEGRSISGSNILARDGFTGKSDRLDAEKEREKTDEDRDDTKICKLNALADSLSSINMSLEHNLSRHYDDNVKMILSACNNGTYGHSIPVEHQRIFADRHKEFLATCIKTAQMNGSIPQETLNESVRILDLAGKAGVLMDATSTDNFRLSDDAINFIDMHIGREETYHSSCGQFDKFLRVLFGDNWQVDLTGHFIDDKDKDAIRPHLQQIVDKFKTALDERLHKGALFQSLVVQRQFEGEAAPIIRHFNLTVPR
jgi:hypothetical protein